MTELTKDSSIADLANAAEQGYKQTWKRSIRGIDKKRTADIDNDVSEGEQRLRDAFGWTASSAKGLIAGRNQDRERIYRVTERRAAGKRQRLARRKNRRA